VRGENAVFTVVLGAILKSAAILPQVGKFTFKVCGFWGREPPLALGNLTPNAYNAGFYKTKAPHV